MIFVAHLMGTRARRDDAWRLEKVPLFVRLLLLSWLVMLHLEWFNSVLRRG
jgi:hypothetical protein